MRQNYIFDEIVKDITYDHREIFDDMRFVDFVKLNLKVNKFWLFYCSIELSVDLINQYFIQYIEEYYDV